MINGETWLFHSSLFDDWVIVREKFVRHLGWFEKLFAIAGRNHGWLTIGSPIKDTDALEIIVGENSEKYLYSLKNGIWVYLPGPIVLTCAGKIVGYAGPKELIASLEAAEKNPWNWLGIQIVEVNPTFTKHVPIGTTANPLEKFNKIASVSHGWMWWPESPEEAFPKETMDAIATGSPIIEVKDGVWFLNSLNVNIASVRIAPGFDLYDLRYALKSCTSKYAWISDTRDWTGWLPKNRYDLGKVHVWPDEHGNAGSELFIPVEKFLEETENAEDLNSLQNLVIYDKQL